MSWKQTAKTRAVLILSIGAMIVMPSMVYAAQYQSASGHYQVNEVFFGSGGALNDCSSTYCAKESIGETAVGETNSSHYEAHAGFNTDRQPFLQFIVTSSSTNIGILNTGSATTSTGTFSVEAYLSSGYQVVTVSNPPMDGSYTMQALTTPTASSPGTEQFGMNLAANTSPSSIGANPVQVPNNSISFGQVSTSPVDYYIPNEYVYVPGSPIAYSSQSSGITDYTISYLYNVSSTTPGGSYTFNDVLVATATF